MTLNPGDAQRLEECLNKGGVVIFPADTVYGIGCDPQNRAAVERMYALKGRPAKRPAAVMFFSLGAALEALPELHERERTAMSRLLPGPLTLLLPNRSHRFPLACGPDPNTLGVRVPLLEGALMPLRAVGVPVVQSSANLSGEADVRWLADVPIALRDGADLVLDGGELPGTASTVLDLRGYEERGEWSVVRDGPVGAEEVERALDPC
ncbi:MAG TPA: Sua5/YciO/YrdC/YwlC family protein [Solirubrobacteraceae bacterium]|jgi:L-threonylcarbamoyladenylate synthase